MVRKEILKLMSDQKLSVREFVCVKFSRYICIKSRASTADR